MNTQAIGKHQKRAVPIIGRMQFHHPLGLPIDEIVHGASVIGKNRLGISGCGEIFFQRTARCPDDGDAGSRHCCLDQHVVHLPLRPFAFFPQSREIDGAAGAGGLGCHLQGFTKIVGLRCGPVMSRTCLAQNGCLRNLDRFIDCDCLDTQSCQISFYIGFRQPVARQDQRIERSQSIEGDRKRRYVF
ncbi:hypothetical protein D3C87_1372580 [compost metagenome]